LFPLLLLIVDDAEESLESFRLFVFQLKSIMLLTIRAFPAWIFFIGSYLFIHLYFELSNVEASQPLFWQFCLHLTSHLNANYCKYHRFHQNKSSRSKSKEVLYQSEFFRAESIFFYEIRSLVTRSELTPEQCERLVMTEGSCWTCWGCKEWEGLRVVGTMGW
jgi:hypothetical protein